MKEKVCNLHHFMTRIKKYTFRTRIECAFKISLLVVSLGSWVDGILAFCFSLFTEFSVFSEIHWILCTLNIISTKEGEREMIGRDFPSSYFPFYTKIPSSSNFYPSWQSHLWRKRTKTASIYKYQVLISPPTCHYFW